MGGLRQNIDTCRWDEACTLCLRGGGGDLDSVAVLVIRLVVVAMVMMVAS